MLSQTEIIESLPAHLQPFCAVQDYTLYTPRDQAVWRFLLHQLRDNLSQSAHTTYLDGLQRSGIDSESIPRIESMNDCLSLLGWSAVVVDGFVPPAIFMEFQAHRVLVVAVDIRSIEHMLYTPAPDIVHESAGHAPFIIDVDYAEFLQRFGELGMRAISSKGDMDVYEAIRRLSITKESPNSSAGDTQAAEAQLSLAIAANDNSSEASLMSRLHWWTVEYGLVGSADDYRLFGAGLLSSLGESQDCLDDDKVKKLPLTVDCITAPYDITQPQPQLFVTKSCRHLSQVLEEFGRQMCVHRGGASSLQKAIAAETVNTAVTNAGIEISGRFSRLLTDAVGNVSYLNTQGPTQLSYNGCELTGHGGDFHGQGFGSPIGRVQSMERCLSSYTIDELKSHGIDIEKLITLEFLSGVVVEGVLNHIVRRDQKNILFTFSRCSVKGPAGEVLFAPEWGVFDMVVGGSVVSVYGGSADKNAYPLYQKPEVQRSYAPSYSDSEQAIFRQYQAVRDYRQQSSHDVKQVEQLIEQLQGLNDIEWLLVFEVLEVARESKVSKPLLAGLIEQLRGYTRNSNKDLACLINYAIRRLHL